MRLLQGQVWKHGREYIRLVRLERLQVEYKTLASLASKEGTKHVVSKKDFCRLLQQARLLGAPSNTARPAAGRQTGLGEKIPSPDAAD